tara:strand:+ start:483 stop:947 length:465 start_codon:yes stop_codon:yes gene_type:complete
MPSYRKRSDGTLLLGEVEVRCLYPDRKFDIPLKDSVANELGFDRIIPTEKPSYESSTHKVVRDGEEEIDSLWYTKWKVEPLTTEEKTSYDERAAALEKSIRNDKLKDTDWTQVLDSPFTDSKKEEWKTYRQALRDLPTASGWPLTHSWPTEPSA